MSGYRPYAVDRMNRVAATNAGSFSNFIRIPDSDYYAAIASFYGAVVPDLCTATGSRETSAEIFL